MSEHLAAARELVRSAIGEIDARLAEIQLEHADLTAHRARLQVVIDGERPTSPPSEVSHAEVAPTSPPAPRRPNAPASSAPGDALPKPIDAALRIMAIVAKRGQATSSDVHTAAKLTNPQAVKRLLTALIDSGRLVRTGKTAATRYSLPSGPPPAASEGDRGGQHAGQR